MKKDFTKELFLPSGSHVIVTRKDGVIKRIFDEEAWPPSVEDEAAFERWFKTPEDKAGYGVSE